LIEKLPWWVEYSAFSLSVSAGCINVVGLMGFKNQAVSHVTGTVSQLGVEILISVDSSLQLAFTLLSFILGAIICGFSIKDSGLKIGRNYSVVLVVEAILLLLALELLVNGFSSGHYFASMACGLQNALFTTYSRAILRTTHLTGIFTDLGLMLGQGIRGREFDSRKAILLLIIIMGYFLGSAIGAKLYLIIHFNALLFPAALSFMLSVIYWIHAKNIRLGKIDSSK